jgi:hypothetical protein
MAKQKRENRTITIDFNDEATYHHLCRDGRAFIEFVVAFIMSLGFQLKHNCSCPGGFALTRHSHYSRIRLGGLVIWRLACKECGRCLPYYLTLCCVTVGSTQPWQKKPSWPPTGA